MPSTVSWYEVFWVLCSLIAALASSIGLVTSWGDLRYWLRHPDPDPQVQSESVSLARVFVRYEAILLLTCLVFLAAGVRLLFLPLSPDPATDLGALLVGLSFAALLLLVTVVTIQNRLARRRFDRHYLKGADMPDTKPWIQSRTLILNVSIVVLTALAAGVEVLMNAGAEITITTILMGLLAGLNSALRLLTGTPIQGSPADPARKDPPNEP